MKATQYFEETWLKNLDPRKRILTGKSYQHAKRAFDLFIIVIAVPFWVPLFVLIALLIKVSSPDGPALFVQLRTGKNGQRFRMFKFRSMIPNAEKLVSGFAEVNSNGELAGPLKLESDPRITKVGKILRKSSLDELPQIINVLLGDMSLVGPRPTSWSPESYKLWHTERLDVLPGITGLWQIYGRGSQDFDDWLRWDIRYLEKRCLWLDVVILFKTIAAVFRRRGAR
jgi:lipopolysaccharide/colanic/teichoic acid biosynthesis glycosyltransferase